MAFAYVTKELHVETLNEPSLLGVITSALACEEVYIIHLCAFSNGDRLSLQMVTKDNGGARRALAGYVPELEERDVLVVEFENKVGTLAPVAKILGNHGIHVRYVYGTSGDGFKIVGIFSTDDNQRAAEVINRETGSLGGRL
jgi:hypothetical protein